MNEARFQARIVAYATIRGWVISHVENVTMTGKGGRIVHRTPAARGFPDLVFARNGRILFLEVKSETGRVSDDQVSWLNHLTGSDHPKESWQSRGAVPSGISHAFVVRPRHWEWIMETLR